MYLPKHFSVDDPDFIANFIAEHDFATLVVIDQGGIPVINHLPLIKSGESLIGHIAFNNPLAESIHNGLSAVAVFSGPHTYISPTWYPSGFAVPTWNYAVVHISGRLEALSHNENIEGIKQLIQRYEDITVPPFAPIWSDEKYWNQTKATVGFRLSITATEAKFKMSQNRNLEDRMGALAGLRASGRIQDQDVADYVERFLPGEIQEDKTS